MDQPNRSYPPEASVGNNQIAFMLNENVYPRDIILKTCYLYIDRMYFQLDIPRPEIIVVTVKGKGKLAPQRLKKFKDDFLNELLNALLRKKISRQNQKLVEYIIGGAVTAALENAQTHTAVPVKEDEVDMNRIEREIEALKKELEEEMEAQG
jgi:His-Xaa-Ser system protein HxsD